MMHRLIHNPKSAARGKALSWLLMLCAALVSASTLSAQVLYGNLTGTVQDKTGAVVPNASVELTSQETGEVRTAQANSAGEYRFVNLLPGQYTASIKAAGSFSAFTEKNITVEINREARVDIALAPASVTQEVTVGTAAAELQTETADVNHEISQSEIAELPLTSSEGRNFQALYTLIPGFAAVAEQNSPSGNPSRAESANVNGVTDTGVTTRIDGAVNVYGWLAYLVAYVPPADAIQSVNIVTNSFNAEQGMAGGAAVNVTIKGGQHAFHGSGWEYYQDGGLNARAYTATQASLINSLNPTGSIPKNVFNQFGGSIGGPVYIPHLLTSRTKLFFFEAFERTTRRQLITGLETVPTTAMLGGDFSATGTTLYDPQPLGVVQTGANTTNGYLNVGFRPTFLSEYGTNAIPASRQSSAAMKMFALLQPISANVTNPNYANQLANDYNGSGTLSYNRNTNDAKINYVPTDRTTVFGRYSVLPYQITDPQGLGAAGGAPFDGGQPGATHGRVQNVGLGMSHIIKANLVVDADAGYTRQNFAAQSTLDIADGDFGLNVLNIPGTNGVGPLYVGQPTFEFSNNNYSSNTFSTLGNAQGANPFQFRDNQFTTDVNVSWTLGKHATKYGFGYYHFDLNHFQPTSGGNIQTVHGGFGFAGGLTTNSSASNGYNSLADFLLGLPNNGTGTAVAHPYQLENPNTLRWTNLSGYAQDQWSLTPKLTLNYGVRYEYYPIAYRDHTGISRLDPSLPQTGNVEIGGVNGNPHDAGVSIPSTDFVPRLGVAYRPNERLVIRAGAGISTDADSMRYLRDSFPIDQAPSFTGAAANSIAINPVNGQALTLAVGIPNPATPNTSTGFVSLPVSGSTNTVPKNFRRGYIESWNLFVQQDLGGKFVMNVGYVGTHQVRQQAGYSLNAAPLPTANTICTSQGTYNASTGLTGTCNFAANELINTNAGCNAGSVGGYICYNTGGVTMNQPLFSANYNGLQGQLTRNAGRLAQFGLIYTWSHAFDYDDNGAGTGSNGTAFSYPAFFKMNRATASYDRTNNLQFWTIYHLPFGAGQSFLNHGIASAIVGGFQLNSQISHVSGGPFSVSPSSTTGFNSPGNTLYAQLIAPYHQLGGHARAAGSPAGGGMPWFDPTSFANPVEPQYTNPNAAGYVPCTAGQVCNATPVFGNTHRNEFRGPGVTGVNASLFRGFHLYKESQFQVRVEAFNILNHAQLISNPNTTVGGGTFGYITSFGASYSPTSGARSLQLSGRVSF
jgi:cytoskeletal protein RodZ